MKGYKHKNKKNNAPSAVLAKKGAEDTKLTTLYVTKKDLPAVTSSALSTFTSGLLSTRHYYLNDGQELKGVLSLPCIKSTSKCR